MVDYRWDDPNAGVTGDLDRVKSVVDFDRIRLCPKQLMDLLDYFQAVDMGNEVNWATNMWRGVHLQRDDKHPPDIVTFWMGDSLVYILRGVG